ncbi:MAG: hypothetical protein FWG34_13190, partial [Oscillospiraceae bacterium]|nr:hypothetical protein [Oscillospiraceae bacterium]
ELMSSETLFCPVCRYKSKNDELLDSNEWSTFCLRCRFNITEFIEKVKETCADNCKNELKNTDYCFTCNTSPLVKLIKEMNPALVSAVYIAPQYMGEYYKNQKSADMPKIADWTCSCSNTNKAAYKFCTECGKQKPVE